MNRISPDIVAIVSGFLVTLLLALFFTRKAIAILPKFGLIDKPQRNCRRIHTREVATAGGIAMFLAFLIGAFLTFNVFLPHQSFEDRPLYFIAPIILVVIFGLLDDKFEFNALTKLVFQIIAGLFCFSIGIKIEAVLGLILPMPISLIFTVFWTVACINAFNLIDGIDGLAAGLGSISSITIGIFLFSIGSIEDSAMMFLLCASCLGFLRYNFKNAKIFMGDTGSSFIGITFAIVSIISSGKLSTFSLLLVPLLALGLPFFDTVLAVVRRTLKKILFKMEDSKDAINVFTADSDHIHHRFLGAFKDNSKVTLLLYLSSSVICALALCLVFIQDYNQFTVILTLVVIVVILGKILAFIETRFLMDLILSLTRKTKFLRFLLILDIISDFAIVGAVSYISNRLFINRWNKPLLEVCLSLVVLGLIYLSFPKLRKIYWAKSTLSQFFYLIKALVCFSLLMLILDYYFFGRYMHLYTRALYCLFIGENLLSFSLILLLISGKKLFIKWSGEIGQRIAYSSYQPTSDIKKTLIYGTDILVKYFRTDFIRKNSKDNKIVGIISDNIVLKSKIVYGYKVLGSLKNIDSLVQSYHINSILIDSNVKESDLAYLKSYCQKHDIELKRISLHIHKV